MKMTFILGWSREVNYKKKYLCEKSKPFVYCNRVEKSKYVNVIVEAKFEKKSAIGRCLLWRKRDKSCETVDDVSGQLLSSNLTDIGFGRFTVSTGITGKRVNSSGYWKSHDQNIHKC